MLSASDLDVHGALAWLRLLGGVLVFLLPGLAGADRWLRGVPGRWFVAPVFSFSLMSLAALALGSTFGVPVTTGATLAIALGVAVIIGRPRLVRAWASVQGGRPQRAVWVPAAALPLVLVFVFVAHSYPHVGAATEAPAWRSPFLYKDRFVDLLTGNDDPYPVHVDEHFHLARFAQIDREGQIHLTDPYTGTPETMPLLTLTGLQTERGWQVGIVQVHQLTDVAFPALARFLPALWSTFLASLVWMALRPGPGALPAAALVASIPTTLRLLGPAFLVPSAFGLVWVVATMMVADRGRGPGRFTALVVLMSGAFGVHLVTGIVSFVAGALVLAQFPGTWTSRATRVAALLLPFAWLYPAYADDLVTQASGSNTLPFNQGVFLAIGWPLGVLATVGAAGSWMRTDRGTRLVRAVTLIALCAGASIAVSLETGHRNDATYTRLVPMFFLGLAILGGYGVGLLGDVVHKAVRRLPRVGAPHVVLTVAALLVPLQHAAAEQYYRVYDDTSWGWVRGFEESDAGPEDVFLSHPWQAPMFAAVSGARPHAYLWPGAPPVHDDDFRHYVVSGGADEAWLRERGITYVVGPIAPNAPHATVAPGVHRIL